MSGYARHRGVTQGHISKLISEGKIRPPALVQGKKIIPELADAMLEQSADPAHQMQADTGRPSEGRMASFAEARIQKLRVDGERAALELAARRGELIARKTVVATLGPATKRLRDRLIRVARDHVEDVREATACQAAIEEAIREFADELLRE